jgi:hypothetical protein
MGIDLSATRRDVKSADRIHTESFVRMILAIIDPHVSGAVDDNLWLNRQQYRVDGIRVRAIGCFVREWNNIEAPGLSQSIHQVCSELSGAAEDCNFLPASQCRVPALSCTAAAVKAPRDKRMTPYSVLLYFKICPACANFRAVYRALPDYSRAKTPRTQSKDSFFLRALASFAFLAANSESESYLTISPLRSPLWSIIFLGCGFAAPGFLCCSPSL